VILPKERGRKNRKFGENGRNRLDKGGGWEDNKPSLDL